MSDDEYDRPIDLWPVGRSRPCAGPCGRMMYPNGTRGVGPVRPAIHQARGLCERCYVAARRLAQGRVPRGTNLPRDVLLEEYTVMRESGVRPSAMPARLGMRRDAFERAMHRARAAGDGRAASWRGMAA